MKKGDKRFGTKTHPDCDDNDNLDQEILSQDNTFLSVAASTVRLPTLTESQVAASSLLKYNDLL